MLHTSFVNAGDNGLPGWIGRDGLDGDRGRPGLRGNEVYYNFCNIFFTIRNSLNDMKYSGERGDDGVPGVYGIPGVKGAKGE